MAPVTDSGTHDSDTFDFTQLNANSNISLMRDLADLHGWTNPTVDGQPDGVQATTSLLAIVWPFHSPGDASGVPDTFGGALAGFFDGEEYIFYDPLALPPDPDPSGPGIIGVPLGTTENGTLGNFVALVNGNTRWDFVFGSFTLGEATGTATAYLNGPDGNEGQWAPNSQYLFGPPPIGGGWNIYSTAAPETGDQMKMTIYLGEFGNCTLKTYLPTGSSNTVNYPLAWAVYNLAVNGYQIMAQAVPGTSIVDGDNAFSLGGGVTLIVSALNVPSDYGPTSVSVSGVTNTGPGSVPVVIQTSTAHGLTMQDRVRIASVLGATLVNGDWWVARVNSATSFEVSDANLVCVFGSGNAYTSGGTVFVIETSAVLNITNVVNSIGLPVIVTTSTPHELVPGEDVELSSVGGILALSGAYTVFQVLSPIEFEIAVWDAGRLDGNGDAYMSGGTVTMGIFQAMLATGGWNGQLFDNGTATTIAVQGVFGAFNDPRDSTGRLRTLAAYTATMPVLYTGSGGAGQTDAAKPVIHAPYVAVRIANAIETRIAGTLWNAYIELDNVPYGTLSTYDNTRYMSWVENPAGLVSLSQATLKVQVGEVGGD